MQRHWKKAIAINAAGIALVVIGAFMPWVTVDTFLGQTSLSGTDGDGVITFTLGVVAAFLLLWTHFRPSLIRGVIIAVIGGLVVLIMMQKITDIGALIADANLADQASIGIGIYVSLLGGIAMLAGAIAIAVISRAMKADSEES